MDRTISNKVQLLLSETPFMVFQEVFIVRESYYLLDNLKILGLSIHHLNAMKVF